MKILIKLAVVIVLLTPMAANADLIEITGTGDNDGIWEITLHEGSFEALDSLLVSQVWWGDTIVDWELAVTFAEALGEVSGVNNFGLGLGPLFAYFEGGESFYFGAFSDGCCFDYGADAFVYNNKFEGLVFATAQRVPEPGTFALLGIGLAALGLSRRRKIG